MTQSAALVSMSQPSPAKFPTCQYDNDFNPFAKPASLNFEAPDVTGVNTGSDRLKNADYENQLGTMQEDSAFTQNLQFISELTPQAKPSGGNAITLTS